MVWRRLRGRIAGGGRVHFRSRDFVVRRATGRTGGCDADPAGLRIERLHGATADILCALVAVTRVGKRGLRNAVRGTGPRRRAGHDRDRRCIRPGVGVAVDHGRSVRAGDQLRDAARPVRDQGGSARIRVRPARGGTGPSGGGRARMGVGGSDAAVRVPVRPRPPDDGAPSQADPVRVQRAQGARADGVRGRRCCGRSDGTADHARTGPAGTAPGHVVRRDSGRPRARSTARLPALEGAAQGR